MSIYKQPQNVGGLNDYGHLNSGLVKRACVSNEGCSGLISVYGSMPSWKRPRYHPVGKNKVMPEFS